MVSFPQAMSFWAQQQGVEVGGIPPTQPIIYYPLLIAQAQVRYRHPAWQGDLRRAYSFQVFEVPPSGMVKWGNWRARPIDPSLVQEKPYAQAGYAPIHNLVLDDVRLGTLRQDMLEFVHREGQMTIPALPALELYANPNEPFPMFQARALETARQQRDAELAAIVTRYENKLAELEESYSQIQSEVNQAAQQISQSQGGSFNIFNIARTTYSLLHRHYFHPVISLIEMGVQGGEQRYQSQEFDKMVQATQAAEFQAQVDMLYQDYYAEVDALNQKWTKLTAQFETFTLDVSRDQISIELFGLGWLPYYSTSYQNQPLLLPAL
jgi:Skp family chaperone for outer membrane proteins